MPILRTFIVILFLSAAGAAQSADFQGRRDGATLYEILGVAETASEADLLDAYRAGVRKLHPVSTAPHEAGFEVLLDVWGVLGRPTLRKLYDAYLTERRRQEVRVDGEYDRLLFKRYGQVLLADRGSPDPASFDHEAAFRVFLKDYEDRLPPRVLAPGPAWASRLGLCGKCLLRLSPIPILAAAVGTLALHQERSPVVPSATPPPAPPTGEPVAVPAPQESAAEKAARRRGKAFGTGDAPQN